MSFSSVSPFPMSLTTRWVCWLHWKYFTDQSYYRYISSLFISQNNGIVLLSLLLIVIFCHPLPPSQMSATTIWGSWLNWKYFSEQSCYCYILWLFYPITMVFFHLHHWWLLYSVVFIWFPTKDKCYHSLGLLVTLEVLFKETILLLYIIIVSLPVQWSCFTITVVDCYGLSYLFPPSPRMSESTSWDWWMHRKDFSERSYYRYIAIYHYNPYWMDCVVSNFSDFYSSAMVPYHRSFYLLLFLSSLFVSSSWMSAATRCDHWL